MKKIIKNIFFGLSRFLPDEIYLKMKYYYRMGKRLNLNNPKTYNEKMQWLKLYDRKHKYTMMVDKYDVKKYVSENIGNEYVIPTLGIWNSFEDIDFNKLPKQFVLKCTHDSGGLVIVRNKKKLDIEAARKKINISLKKNYYWHGREWPYKNVKPRIIAEKYMIDETSQQLNDYKFFVFNGEVKAMFIASDRLMSDEETKFDFFDRDFNHLSFTNGHPNAKVTPSKPKKFDKMIYLAEKLAKDISQMRIDFYEVNGEIYFGELTFYHWSGMIPFEPNEWDEIFGSWIALPNKSTF